jgi:hypothetical protein
MSAAQPKPADAKPADAKAAEPSMEEILASIRRIISDDQGAKPAPPPEPAPPPAAAPPPPPAPPPAAARVEEDDILDLAPIKAARRPEPHFLTDDPVPNDISFDEPKPEPPAAQDDIDALMAAAEVEPPAPTPEPPAPAPPPAMPGYVVSPIPAAERLLSPSTDRVVSSAFTNLANTVLTNNAKTLDDVVQDMLRPMVKAWLDDNLPGIVERLVRAEIERVARGGR